MRHLIALALASLLVSKPAHAEVRVGLIVAGSVAAAVALTGAGLLGYGIYQLEHAQGAPTVGDYHSRVATTRWLEPLGAGMMVAGAMTAIFMVPLSRAPVRKRVAVVPSGLGLAVRGMF